MTAANTVYVSTASGNLYPITIATNALGSPLGTVEFQRMAVSPDYTLLYGTEQSPSNIFNIDLTSFSVTSNIVGSGSPSGIDFAPNGLTAYYCGLNSPGFLYPIDVPTFTQGTSIGIDDGPRVLAIDPTGAYAYVVCGTLNKLDKVNLSTFATTSITVGNNVEDICMNPAGTMLWLASYGNNEVIPVSLATFAAGTPISPGNGPFALCITPDGTTLYCVNQNDNTVVPITASTGTVGTPIPVGNTPTGICMAPDGSKVFTADYFSSQSTPILVATNTAQTPVALGSNAVSIVAGPPPPQTTAQIVMVV